MRCQTCDYPLWGITERRCPECGNGFAPSDFSFAVNTVAFCCPHCGQDYYGTGEEGHLDPVEFDCVSCGTHIHMDETVLRPTTGVEESRTAGERSRWLTRRRGYRKEFYGAFFATVGLAMTMPTRLARQLHGEAKWTSALWFGACTFIIAAAIPILILTGVALTIVLAIASGGGSSAMQTSTIFLTVGVPVGVGVVGLLLQVFGVGLIAHGALKVTGKTERHLSASLEASGYAAAPWVITAIPCIGFYVAAVSIIWSGVSLAFIIRTRHAVSWTRAIVAATLGTVLAWGVPVGIVVWWVMNIFFAAFPTTPASASGHVGANTVYSALYPSGVPFSVQPIVGPQHAAQLVADGRLTAFDLVTSYSNTFPGDIPVGPNYNLETFESADPADQTAAIRAAAPPPDTVAHRLGDFVFTWHGIGMQPGQAQLATPAQTQQSPPIAAVQPPASNDLWVIVVSPDPDRNAVPTGSDLIVIVEADGDRIDFPARDFRTELTIQNAERQSVGLPPLPADLLDLRHGSPALGRRGWRTASTAAPPAGP